MKATTEILKGIFLKGYTMKKGIILIPLSIIEIIFYIFYSALKKINMQFILPYIIQLIIILIVAYNIWTVVSKSKYRKSCMFILLFFTYPIFAEFPEIQLHIFLTKIIIFIAWITEIIKEYIFFDKSYNSFSKNMITMYIIVCIMLEHDFNYVLLLILLLLVMVNLLNSSKIK